ncbi:hypothetical protein P691DRAFT_784149 [Macrolepiota fuliginosa MF-IS2]|uniref:Uncharacterized protein n=1 Tax=Macrolepiota fuliginosa MF-IS2 TaxID=1400762 RepID=A0A9P5X8U1_9AGAR|nr:hypothetical protein P691DRAFT_784149 [Macrolepiota fuliginosa MF-IS2]
MITGQPLRLLQILRIFALTKFITQALAKDVLVRQRDRERIVDDRPSKDSRGVGKGWSVPIAVNKVAKLLICPVLCCATRALTKYEMLVNTLSMFDVWLRDIPGSPEINIPTAEPTAEASTCTNASGVGNNN